MGNGYLEYKKRWCNYQYDLETHIFYKKTSIIARALAFKETNEILLKNIAKDLLNSTTIKRIKNFYKTKINTKILFPNYNIEKIEPFTNTLALIKIDLKKNHEFDFINQHVYNFIYTYKEHFDSVSVYKIPNETESFIVKGKDNSIKVIFNK